MVAATCVGVGLAGESRLLLIVIDRVAEIVLVDKVVTRVVGWVDVVKQLCAAGLVSCRKEGRWARYSANSETAKLLSDWISN